MMALALAAMGASAPAARAGVKPPQIKLDYEKYTLPNGLEVILREDHRLPIVAVNTWYHVGPANETAGRTGFAHLFEHMMFQSSGHVGEDQFWKYMEGAGASFINGTTDFDRTNYMEDVPSNQLEMALWLESDRMGYLQDRLTAASLANQQDVVRNERRQSIENAPYQIVEEQMWHMIFPQNHPYYPWVIGSHEDIQAAKIDDVRDFFKRYYTPNNASLVIVGDIDKVKTKALVEKYYGTIPRGPSVPAITATTPPLTSEKRAVVTDKVELPRVYFSWLTSPIYKPGDADAVVAADILGGGKASRLFKSLVYEKQIAQDVSASQQSLQLGSVFTVTITVKPGHTPEEVEKAAQEELTRFEAEGPSAGEVEASQNSIYSGIVTSLENFGGFGGVADRLNMYNQHLKNPGYLNQDLARFASVTPATVKKFAQGQLRNDARVVVYAVPGEKKLPPNPPAPPKPEGTETKAESAEPWRNTVPTAGPVSRAALPTPKRFTLPNGLQVYLVEAHNLPVVATNLVFRSGSAADPKTSPGLAGFTASMLDEGTDKMDALTIANKVQALGATLNTGTTADGSNANVRALKQNARPALGILSDVVLTPAFPEKEIDRIRNDRLTALLQQRDQPFQTAIRVMNASLYGPTHPYGHTALGTEESIKKISRDDLTTFYKSSYSPKNAALVMVGDLTEAEARKLAVEAFGGWKGGETPSSIPAEGAVAQSRVIIVDKPGSPQTAVLAGQMGVARSNPDYEKLDVMNTVLGGLFSSRINLNLREDKGYSYGAFSFIGQNRGVGPVMAGAAVRADVTGPSVDEVLKEVTKMRDAGVTDAELTMAKDSMVRSLPANFETTFSTAGTMAQIYLYDLPLDYYQTLPARVDAISRDDVGAVAKKYLTPDRMLIVAVGDKKLIEPQISKLSLGTIAYRDADGNEIAASN
ncbi:MAG TPA: pitrilysin family protein [Candidatus Limnocylindrales bacterium]|nr:pitrilysin family protein [Candidatus Limnocylindrales bacterium]